MYYSLWYNGPTMLPASSRPATSWVHYTTSCNTQSSAPEDGQNDCPKNVELTGIINKSLLLHLVGCLYYPFACFIGQTADHIWLLCGINSLEILSSEFNFQIIYLFNISNSFYKITINFLRFYQKWRTEIFCA